MDYYTQKESLAQCGQSNALAYVPPSLVEQIEARIQDLKNNLQKQEELLVLIRRNPDIQKILELMR